MMGAESWILYPLLLPLSKDLDLHMYMYDDKKVVTELDLHVIKILQ